MKQQLLIVVVTILSLFCPASVWAEDKELSQEQRALRSDILAFLKEEGFGAEIDSDGDIRFKSDGNTYYVSVSSVDENPMYISLYMPFNNPDEYSADAVVMATKALNKYKGVKVVCFDSSFRISAELYLRDSELFKESFYKLKSQMDNVRSDFVEECKNVGSGSGSISEFPFIITKMEVANVEYDGTIIQDFNSTIYDFKSKYLQPRITIKPQKKSGTYTVYVRLYKNNVLQRNTSSSPENFTFSSSITLSGKPSQVETLMGWGSKNAGIWSQGSYRFEVWYNDYCIGSKTFKVI